MTDDRVSNQGEADRERIDSLVADYIDRLIGGEKLFRDDILAKHPDVGEEIMNEVEAFADLDCGESADPLGTLGDYTLRRQIGRGGMGVVYEAWIDANLIVLLEALLLHQHVNKAAEHEALSQSARVQSNSRIASEKPSFVSAFTVRR